MREKITKQTRRLVAKEMRLHARMQTEDTIKALACIFAGARFWRRIRLALVIVFCKPAAIEYRMVWLMFQYSKRLTKGKR